MSSLSVPLGDGRRLHISGDLIEVLNAEFAVIGSFEAYDVPGVVEVVGMLPTFVELDDGRRMATEDDEWGEYVRSHQPAFDETARK